MERWSKEKAWEFWNNNPWMVGCTLHGGEVWQNVKIEQMRFKTEQGIGLKSYQKIEAIEFVANENGYLLNNALWV